MRKTILGKSGLEVSQIGFGTGQVGGDGGSGDASSAVAMIRRALEVGVNFFDLSSAAGAGQAESRLARALRGVHREDVVIASNGSAQASRDGLLRDPTGANLRRAVEESLRAFGTSYLDVYQLTSPDPAAPIEEWAIALYDLVADGMVRHVGVSDLDVAQTAALNAILPIETLRTPYHLFAPAATTEVFSYAAARDLGVVIHDPLAHGLLEGSLTAATSFAASDWRAASELFRGEALARNLAVTESLNRFARRDLGLTLAQLSIAWTLANSAVHVAMVGTGNSTDLLDAVVAANTEFSDGELSAIEAIMRDAVPVSAPGPEVA
jgi:hypothetical protein